jgi:hypothetical protein
VWLRESQINPKAALIADVNSVERARGMVDPHIVVLDGFWEREDARHIADTLLGTQLKDPATARRKFGLTDEVGEPRPATL